MVTYAEQPFVDFFDEKATLLHRVDVSAIFDNYEGLELHKLE